MIKVVLEARLSHSRLVPAGRGFQFALLTAAVTAALYARTAVNPVQENMRIGLGLTDNEVALLQGLAPAMAAVIASIPVGLIVDRQSRRVLLILLCGLGAVGTLLTALASSFGLLLAARSLTGLAHAATSITAFSLLADLYQPSERGRTGMVLILGQSAGMAGAFALGGTLLSVAQTGADSWRWTLLWMGAPLVLIFFLLLRLSEPPRKNVVHQNKSLRETFRELWGYRSIVMPLLLGMVMAEIGSCAALVWAAPMLERRFGVAPDRIGIIMSSIVLVGTVLGSVGGGLIADRAQRNGGPRRTLLLLSYLALLSAPAGLFAAAGRIAQTGLLLATFLMLVSAIIVMVLALATIVVPGEVHGVCLASMIGANTLFGVALAPLLVSVLSNAMGGANMLGSALALVCAPTGLFGALFFTLGRRQVTRGDWCAQDA